MRHWLRENAKFCDECGAPTTASGDTAKYKQVTVLFADVVHSMDLAAALEMERYREVMTELVGARRRWCSATAAGRWSPPATG